MSDPAAVRAAARADLCRFLAACYYLPGPEFAEEHVFDSMRDAAAKLDPDFAEPVDALGRAFAATPLQDLQVDYTALFLNPTGSIAGSLAVKVGSGDDHVFVDQVAIQGNAQVVTSSGVNDVVCTDSSVGGNLTITAGSGNDSVDTTGTVVGGTTKVDADGGTNTITP